MLIWDEEFAFTPLHGRVPMAFSKTSMPSYCFSLCCSNTIKVVGDWLFSLWKVNYTLVITRFRVDDWQLNNGNSQRGVQRSCYLFLNQPRATLLHHLVKILSLTVRRNVRHYICQSSWRLGRTFNIWVAPKVQMPCEYSIANLKRKKKRVVSTRRERNVILPQTERRTNRLPQVFSNSTII